MLSLFKQIWKIKGKRKKLIGKIKILISESAKSILNQKVWKNLPLIFEVRWKSYCCKLFLCQLRFWRHWYMITKTFKKLPYILFYLSLTPSSTSLKLFLKWEFERNLKRKILAFSVRFWYREAHPKKKKKEINHVVLFISYTYYLLSWI